MARKWECQNLLNCHLAISCSWIDYHTSSERGDSGVSADSKKFWIFHTNGYFQAYFWVALGSTKLHPQLGLSLSHFFSDIRLPYPHLKRIPRAFIWTQMLENIFSNKRARAWGNLYVGNPSYSISRNTLQHDIQQYSSQISTLPFRTEGLQMFWILVFIYFTPPVRG